MTETGLSLGTPHYMSPEQATADKEITARSDIYSLGSVPYEMLAGSPPHVGASAQQIIMKIVTEEATPVTRLRKAVPHNVASVVANALEKLPADRFGSAREFAEALANPAFTRGSATVGRGSRATPSERRPDPAFVALGLLTLISLAVTAWAVLDGPAPGAVARYSTVSWRDCRWTGRSRGSP
jgi:serine/threonine-protein kinase